MKDIGAILGAFTAATKCAAALWTQASNGAVIVADPATSPPHPLPPEAFSASASHSLRHDGPDGLGSTGTLSDSDELSELCAVQIARLLGAEDTAELAQDADQRREGQHHPAEFDARALEDQCVADPAAELVHQPRFTDACLATEQEYLTMSFHYLLDDGLEGENFSCSADQDG